MIDLMDFRVAHALSEHHLYPFAENIYVKIFRSFSHFPLPLSDLKLEGEGHTITLIALVVLNSLKLHCSSFSELYPKMLGWTKEEAQPIFPQDTTVETCIGCMLYLYHPADLHDAMAMFDPENIFNQKQMYEYEFKKKTVLMNAV